MVAFYRAMSVAIPHISSTLAVNWESSIAFATPGIPEPAVARRNGLVNARPRQRYQLQPRQPLEATSFVGVHWSAVVVGVATALTSSVGSGRRKRKHKNLIVRLASAVATRAVVEKEVSERRGPLSSPPALQALSEHAPAENDDLTRPPATPHKSSTTAATTKKGVEGKIEIALEPDGITRIIGSQRYRQTRGKAWRKVDADGNFFLAKRKPKPSFAFFRYSQDHRENLMHLSLTDQAKELANKWVGLTPSEQEVYEKSFATESAANGAVLWHAKRSLKPDYWFKSMIVAAKMEAILTAKVIEAEADSTVEYQHKELYFLSDIAAATMPSAADVEATDRRNQKLAMKLENSLKAADIVVKAKSAVADKLIDLRNSSEKDLDQLKKDLVAKRYIELTGSATDTLEYEMAVESMEAALKAARVVNEVYKSKEQQASSKRQAAAELKDNLEQKAAAARL